MAQEYWVRRQDKIIGLFPGQQLKQMAAAGMILASDMISAERINRQVIPANLVWKADESFKDCKELQKAWRGHIYESERVSWKKLMQGQMNTTGLILTRVLNRVRPSSTVRKWTNITL